MPSVPLSGHLTCAGLLVNGHWGSKSMNAIIRKRLLGEEGTTSPSTADEIELATCARIAYSSEDPSHPVENLFDRRFGPAATCWKRARPDVTDRLIIEFNQAQPISKLIYEVEETECQRTQEVDRKSPRLNSSHYCASR